MKNTQGNFHQLNCMKTTQYAEWRQRSRGRRQRRRRKFSLQYYVRGLLEKYPTFGREKETGLPGALDT